MLHTLPSASLAKLKFGGDFERRAHSPVLARIERLNPALNALITLTAEQALLAAAAADRRRAAAKRAPCSASPHS